jgi:hypothetical protein
VKTGASAPTSRSLYHHTRSPSLSGSGYQAAVLARLAREVYSIECLAELQDRARNPECNGGHERVFQVRRLDAGFGKWLHGNSRSIRPDL